MYWFTIAILVGVALARVAVPPLIERAKSPTSTSPVALLALKTGSSKVTVTVELSVALIMLVMIAPFLSWR